MPLRKNTTTSEPRVVVFIDEANVYHDARRAFHAAGSPAPCGQVKPMRYAELIASRQPLGSAGDRRLTEARVYTGRPSQKHDPGSYAAHRRQIDAWEKAGVTVKTRTLRYPQDWPTVRPRQKGVDVQIAIDMVLMAVNRELDVAILASTDTDLRPAVEALHALPAEIRPVVEVAAWKRGGFAKRLNLPNVHVWCHYLEEQDYRAVADHRDYNVP
jgi:uncharacterized LabA/DUF88 family protein